MAELYKDLESTAPQYRHYQVGLSEEDASQLLESSCTLYVGNLSFYTTEEQLYELFSKCGEIRRIIMGLDKIKKTPCGFSFVEYYTHEDASDCVKYITGTRLDDRTIRCDWDVGFKDGRQYGRGKTGGQVRDEHRTDYDPGRGGYGKLRQIQETSPKTQYHQPMGIPISHYNARFEESASNWRGKSFQNKKRDRIEADDYDSSSKRIKGSEEDKNPRFRESDQEDKEDEDQEME